MNAILYLLRTGCPWRYLPRDGFPPRSTVYTGKPQPLKASYPILDITEAPEAIVIVPINRPELPPAGAGESSVRPVAAALANAVFDATGVRLRRAPLTPGAAQAGAGVMGAPFGRLFDHPVREHQEGRGDGDAKGLGGL